MGLALLVVLSLLARAGEPVRLESPLEPVRPAVDAAAPLSDAAAPLQNLSPQTVSALPAAPFSVPPAANEPMPAAAKGASAAAEPKSAETQSAESSARFDNAYKPKSEVVAALGFDPVGRTGQLLSVPTKADVRVIGLARVVAKVAARAEIARELFVRNVIVETPLFRDHFDVIPGDGFRRRFLDRLSVLVMERVPLRRAPEPPIARKAALAALAYGLGISDHNEDGLFEGKDGKTLVNDFEKALTPLREDMRAGALSDPPLHLSAAYLNDYADYAPAVEAWRRALAARQEELARLMRKSGMTGREARRALALLNRNAELMEGQLKKDLARENLQFVREAERAGLTPRQIEALSGVNRAASSGDPSMRDAVRRYIRERGRQARRWTLWPETSPGLSPAEWADYLESRADNNESDRS